MPLAALLALALALPGLGHLVLGRRKRALAYLAIVGVTTGVGLLLHGQLYSFNPARPLSCLGFLTVSATGLLGLAARLAGLAPADAPSATQEYGTTYLLTAGLMNLLLLIDVRDIARGRKP